jgi:hypothetical protein
VVRGLERYGVRSGVSHVKDLIGSFRGKNGQAELSGDSN